jgi:hypothetical protein
LGPLLLVRASPMLFMKSSLPPVLARIVSFSNLTCDMMCGRGLRNWRRGVAERSDQGGKGVVVVVVVVVG